MRYDVTFTVIVRPHCVKADLLVVETECADNSGTQDVGLVVVEKAMDGSPACAWRWAPDGVDCNPCDDYPAAVETAIDCAIGDYIRTHAGSLYAAVSAIASPPVTP